MTCVTHEKGRKVLLECLFFYIAREYKIHGSDHTTTTVLPVAVEVTVTSTNTQILLVVLR